MALDDRLQIDNRPRLAGELWGVYYEDLGENGPGYNVTEMHYVTYFYDGTLFHYENTIPQMHPISGLMYQMIYFIVIWSSPK